MPSESPSPHPTDGPFRFDEEAIRDAASEAREHYVLPDFTRFSDLVVSSSQKDEPVITDPTLQRTYLDGLTDLHHLVEEYRFEALLALTLLRDFVIKRDRGELEDSSDAPFLTMPIPAEVKVLLLGFVREPPTGAELFENPHQGIAKNRTLSRWFAAQLIDSALYRGVAACDRLAILLRCQAGLPVRTTKRGTRRQPAFLGSDLDELNEAFAAIPEWKALRELADSELLEFIKEERNGFTHERRRPSLLHGEGPVVYGADGPGQEETVGTLDPQTHYAMAPAFYNEVLKPGIELTRSILLAAADPS